MAEAPRAARRRAKSDHSYKEVRRTIVKNQKKRENADEGVVQESYVDQYRSLAVHLGTSDLKSTIRAAGRLNKGSAAARTAKALQGLNPADLGPGEPNDVMYLKQAEHLMKRGTYKPALIYLQTSLKMNPASKTAKSTRARCYLMMGLWEHASQAADAEDKNFVRALLVKAEALYNTCNFEHALVLFHRGQLLSPEVEDFRLGIQKCRKTIQCTVSKDFKFHVPGIETLFQYGKYEEKFS